MTALSALHVFPTLDIGGQQTRFATIANRLGKKFQHRLITLDGRFAAMSLLDPGIDASLVPLATGAHSVLNRIREMSWLVRTLNPDILVTYNWGAIEWAISTAHLHEESMSISKTGLGPMRLIGKSGDGALPGN